MEQENTPKKSLTCREFLKRFHTAAAVTCASTWVGCTSGQKNTEEQTSSTQSKKQGEMTYRITPNTGDKVSLLGYGCMPCPYGIDIPGILSHFNKCINEDLMPVSSQDENYRELRRAFLIGYDRSVPKLRQADHCVGCDQCIRKCPQRINIPKQRRRIGWSAHIDLLMQRRE